MLPIDLRLEAFVIDFERLFFRGLCNKSGEFGNSLGLCKVVVSPEFHSFNSGVDSRLTG